MIWRNTIFFFVCSYVMGWGLYLINNYNPAYTMFYVMGLFVLINIFTVFHPLIFHYGIMRPLQLSVSSAAILSLLENQISMFTFFSMLLITLVFIEKEDVFAIQSKGIYVIKETVSKVLLTFLLPFSVTYCVLILRPYENITSLMIVTSYFAVLFVLSKWFKSIFSFSLFIIIQMILLVFLLEKYIFWNSVQITVFFFSIFVFLLISYGRKGLLKYSTNNN